MIAQEPHDSRLHLIAMREDGHMLAAFDGHQFRSGYPGREHLSMLREWDHTVGGAVHDQDRRGDLLQQGPPPETAMTDAVSMPSSLRSSAQRSACFIGLFENQYVLPVQKSRE